MAVVIPIVSEFDGKGISKAVAQFQQLEGVGEKAQFALKKAAVPAAAALAGVAVAIGDATKAGANLIRGIESRKGKASRVLWPAYIANQEEVARRMQDLLDRLFERVKFGV